MFTKCYANGEKKITSFRTASASHIAVKDTWTQVLQALISFTKFLLVRQSVEKIRNTHHQNNISLNQLFSNFFITSKVSKMIIWEIQYFGVQAQSRVRQPEAKSRFYV